ncbi:hypothetical protein J4414_02265, partial [Candidatus Woesearchaeota archaeon]|nr:hypothetical protein [Candidatus Woesearchaeota archaeon]
AEAWNFIDIDKIIDNRAQAEIPEIGWLQGDNLNKISFGNNLPNAVEAFKKKFPDVDVKFSVKGTLYIKDGKLYSGELLRVKAAFPKEPETFEVAIKSRIDPKEWPEEKYNIEVTENGFLIKEKKDGLNSYQKQIDIKNEIPGSRDYANFIDLVNKDGKLTISESSGSIQIDFVGDIEYISNLNDITIRNIGQREVVGIIFNLNEKEPKTLIQGSVKTKSLKLNPDGEFSISNNEGYRTYQGRNFDLDVEVTRNVPKDSIILDYEVSVGAENKKIIIGTASLSDLDNNDLVIRDPNTLGFLEESFNRDKKISDQALINSAHKHVGFAVKDSVKVSVKNAKTGESVSFNPINPPKDLKFVYGVTEGIATENGIGSVLVEPLSRVDGRELFTLEHLSKGTDGKVYGKKDTYKIKNDKVVYDSDRQELGRLSRALRDRQVTPESFKLNQKLIQLTQDQVKKVDDGERVEVKIPLGNKNMLSVKVGSLSVEGENFVERNGKLVSVKKVEVGARVEEGGVLKVDEGIKVEEAFTASVDLKVNDKEKGSAFVLMDPKAAKVNFQLDQDVAEIIADDISKLTQDHSTNVNLDYEVESKFGPARAIDNTLGALSEIPILGFIFELIAAFFKLLFAPFGFLVSGEATIPFGEEEAEIAEGSIEETIPEQPLQNE